MLTRSLRSLTVLFLILFLMTTVLGGIGLYTSTRATLTRLADDQIVSISRLVAPDDARLSDAQLTMRIRRMIDQRDTGALGFILSSPDGRILIANVRPARMPPVGFSYLSHDDGIAGLQYGRAYVRAIPGGLHLTVLTETEPFSRYFILRTRMYLIVFGLITAVVLIGLLLFHRLIDLRMRAMHATVEAIIEGDMAQRVPRTGAGDAFEGMAIGFNRMLDRIEGLMDQITHISSDVAHEMRSPLTRLRTRLTLLEQQAEAEPVRNSLTQAIADTDHVLALMAAILRVAEIETGKRRAKFGDVRLDLLAMEVVETLAPLAEEAGMALSFATNDKAPLPMTGDRQLLIQMLMNLIENAIRHAHGATRIAVTLTQAPECLVLTVCDNGQGMSADDREVAIQRFGRAERSRTTAGYGLGLPLVLAIARLHFGGTLELSAASPGLCVTVTLPRSA